VATDFDEHLDGAGGAELVGLPDGAVLGVVEELGVVVELGFAEPFGADLFALTGS
jgi:hypothetical protein